MSLKNKSDANKRFKNSSHKRSFRATFAPQEILANPNRPEWLHLSPANINVVFLDFETTGGNPSNSSIIEIGAIKYFQGKEVGRFETLIKPRHSISGIVQKITGISNKMVENSPPFEDIAEDFFEFIGDAVIVAHGALGDMAFVAHHYQETKGKELPNYYFCTHLLVSHFLPNIPSKTLTGVAQYFNLNEIPAHKAMNDAQLTCEVFWKLVRVFERHGFKSSLDLLKIQADNETLKKLGPGINPSLSESLPMTSGVVMLTSPDQEISFMTATQNIRKTYNKLTTMSLDREFNKIIAHVEGFKYERANHFLDALLKENKQLQRIHLNLDPRKLQNRSDHFVQIFIPEDMLEFAQENPGQLPFSFPQTPDYQFDSVDEDYLPDESTQRSGNFILDFHKSDEKIQVVKARKAMASSSNRYALSRQRGGRDNVIEAGYLKEGVGYVYGPFEKPKEIQAWLVQLLDHVPFHSPEHSMRDRFFYLKAFLAFLNQNLEGEWIDLKNYFSNHLSFKETFLMSGFVGPLQKAKILKNIPCLFHRQHLVKSGIAVISNNELKELDVYVVVQGVVQNKVRLPIEQADKLKSSRYFTRLFEKSYETILNPYAPITFSAETCSHVELFTYWLTHKRGEGEWIDFLELEPLYDISILC